MTPLRFAELTDLHIAQLRDAARAAGDWDMAIICNRALRGSQRARRQCLRTINAARAMDDCAGLNQHPD